MLRSIRDCPSCDLSCCARWPWPMGTGPARASGVSDNVVVDGAEMGVRVDELGLAAGLSDVM